MKLQEFKGMVAEAMPTYHVVEGKDKQCLEIYSPDKTRGVEVGFNFAVSKFPHQVIRIIKDVFE